MLKNKTFFLAAGQGRCKTKAPNMNGGFILEGFFNFAGAETAGANIRMANT